MRQCDVLVTIRNFHHLHGYMPSVRDLSTLLGKARGTIQQHLDSLAARGAIRKHRAKARAIEILQAA
jgi:SOS-response transcriptional repressor LexA